MTFAMELDPATEKLTQAKAEAKGLPLENDLPALVAQAVQEDGWGEPSAARLTMLGAEAVVRRLWDMPEEGEAWKDL